MSCRFDADYRGNAMLRGDADYRGEPCLDFTFDVGVGLYENNPVVPGLVPLDKSLALACNETKTGIQISDTSPKAFWRVQNDHTANQAYKARRFNIVVDDVGDYAIVITNVHEFSPYITVNRSLNTWWQGPTKKGRFAFSVDSLQTGPMTVEVSTTERYDQGSFDIKLVCLEELEAKFTSVPTDLEVSFTNTSTSTYTIQTYDWDFGDGEAHGNSENPIHEYVGDGDYSVTLTITDIYGRTDSVTHTVTVTDSHGPPICGLTINSIGVPSALADSIALYAATAGTALIRGGGTWLGNGTATLRLVAYCDPGGNHTFYLYIDSFPFLSSVYAHTGPNPYGIYGIYSGLPLAIDQIGTPLLTFTV